MYSVNHSEITMVLVYLRTHLYSEGIVFILFITHVFGVILLIINFCYLRCTRGHQSVRLEANQCRLCTKRLCKIRNTVACNILIIFEIVLVGIDIVLIITTQDYPIIYMFMAIAGYVVISVVCFPTAYVTGSCQSYSHIGPLSACTVFECLNLILFCAVSMLMISCSVQEYSNLHPDWKGLASSPGLILVGITYVMLILGASIHFSSFKVYAKIICKAEAVNIINEKLIEVPFIKWKFSCNHQDPNAGKSIVFHQMVR